MNRKKNNSNNGLAFAGLLGLGLGALGTYIWQKLEKDDKTTEQQRQLSLLKNEINEKNRQINEKNNSKIDTQEQNETDSETLSENPNLQCPISNILMTEPVIVVKCGHTFQKDALEDWMKKKKICPLCLVQIEEKDLQTNYNMKGLIADIVKKRK